MARNQQSGHGVPAPRAAAPPTMRTSQGTAAGRGRRAAMALAVVAAALYHVLLFGCSLARCRPSSLRCAALAPHPRRRVKERCHSLPPTPSLTPGLLASPRVLCNPSDWSATRHRHEAAAALPPPCVASVPTAPCRACGRGRRRVLPRPCLQRRVVGPVPGTRRIAWWQRLSPITGPLLALPAHHPARGPPAPSVARLRIAYTTVP